MAIYKYKVIREAKEYEEEKEFTDKGALYAYVRKNDWSLISAEEVRTRKISLKFFSFSKKIKMAEQITFAKNMAVMIDAGLSVGYAFIHDNGTVAISGTVFWGTLSILEEQASRRFVSTVVIEQPKIVGRSTLAQDLQKIMRKLLESFPNALVIDRKSVV